MLMPIVVFLLLASSVLILWGVVGKQGRQINALEHRLALLERDSKASAAERAQASMY